MAAMELERNRERSTTAWSLWSTAAVVRMRRYGKWRGTDDGSRADMVRGE
jgi:hypothetical protein